MLGRGAQEQGRQNRLTYKQIDLSFRYSSTSMRISSCLCAGGRRRGRIYETSASLFYTTEAFTFRNHGFSRLPSLPLSYLSLNPIPLAYPRYEHTHENRTNLGNPPLLLG